MTESLGKKFESIVKENWKRCFPNTFFYRLPDMMGGFAGVGGSNPCDFIAYIPENYKDNNQSKLFMLEIKEHKGNTIGWDAIRQYDKLLQYKNLSNVYPGAIIWFSEKDKVIWVPIEEMEKMHKDGKKSINIKMLDEKQYNIIDIPSVKKRVFLESDYSVLLHLSDKNIV